MFVIDRTFSAPLLVAMALLPWTANAESPYLRADPGKAYIRYFPHGGAVGLDLKKAQGTFTGHWVNIDTGLLDDQINAEGGRIVTLETPSEGPWAAYLKPTVN